MYVEIEEFQISTLNSKELGDPIKKKRGYCKKVKPKYTDEEIISAYEKFGNIWKAGEFLGRRGQYIWDRLKKLKIKLKYPALTEEEKLKIRKLYELGFLRDSNAVKNLSLEIGRTVPFISRYAKEIGLSTNSRKLSKSKVEKMRNFLIGWHKTHEHPKGMLGKKHSEEVCDLISEKTRVRFSKETPDKRNQRILKQLKTREANGTLVTERKNVTWKASWRKIGESEKYYRSSWEANYARYLQMLLESKQIQKWEHEPQIFWFEKIKRGVRSYLPDFRVTDLEGKITWHEVKGYYDSRSLTKIKRFRKYYKKETLIVIDTEWFNKNQNETCMKIKDWEFAKNQKRLQKKHSELYKNF